MSAEYRSVKTHMWRDDEWFQEQPTDARLLFIYLFTNPSASAAGIYRLPLRTIAFESGIPLDRTAKLLAQFSEANKAHFENGIVWVVKMREHQFDNPNVKMEKHYASELAKIPPCQLRTMYMSKYGYSISSEEYPIDRVSIPYTTTVTRNSNSNITKQNNTVPVGTCDPSFAPDVAVDSPALNGSNGKHLSPQQEMFGAIAEACELDATLRRGQISKNAKLLIDSGYTPAQVRGFKAWWQSDPWRMEHTPTPSLNQLLDKINQAPKPPEPKVKRTMFGTDPFNGQVVEIEI